MSHAKTMICRHCGATMNCHAEKPVEPRDASRHIQQHDRHSCRRRQRRDPAPHRPRPNYAELRDAHEKPSELSVLHQS